MAIKQITHKIWYFYLLIILTLKPNMSKTKENLFSAADTSIGFDYQYYYFFYQILNLGVGQKIGYEVKDDIHLELNSGRIILIQTKHSLQKDASGEPINLTALNIDLWKTISNWATIIDSQPNKREYILKTSFQLVTNKRNLSNPFLEEIFKFQNKISLVEDFKKYIKDLQKSTSNETIKNYISNLLKLSNNNLKLFSENLIFELNEDNLIDKIKNRLLEKIHIPERIDDVYSSLDSALRSHNYLTTKYGNKIEISFEDFNNRFRNCFKVGLSNKLPLRNFTPVLPAKLEDQNFIKQLIDIGDIKVTDKDTIVEYTSQMLRLFNNLKAWENKGELLTSELDSFKKDSILKWKNSFKAKHRGIANLFELKYEADKIEKDIIKSALDCLDEVRAFILTIDETSLDTELSNGHFYHLTEEKSIGFHYNWEEKYR
jgi:hypothetical protein